MNHFRKYLLLATFMIAVSVSAQRPVESIPAFTFFSFDGRPFTNKDLAPGKLIFLVFFDISCDHCQQAMGKINKHYNELKGAAIYLVTWDNKKAVGQFMKKYASGLPARQEVTILQDTKHAFINLFRPVKYPSMFLFSKNKELLLYDDDPDHFDKFLAKVRSSK